MFVLPQVHGMLIKIQHQMGQSEWFFPWSLGGNNMSIKIGIMFFFNHIEGFPVKFPQNTNTMTD